MKKSFKLLAMVLCMAILSSIFPKISFALSDTKIIEDFESYAWGSTNALTYTSNCNANANITIEQKNQTPSWESSKAAKISIVSTNNNGWITSTYNVPTIKKDFTGYEGIKFKYKGPTNLIKPSINLTIYDTYNRPFTPKASGIDFYLKPTGSDKYYKSNSTWGAVALPLSFDGEILVCFEEFRFASWYSSDTTTRIDLNGIKTIQIGFSSTTMAGQSLFLDDISLYKTSGENAIPTSIQLKSPEVAYIPDRLPEYMDITPAILNSSGIDIQGQLDWSITPKTDNITISNGLMTIYPLATEGNYTVMAKLNGSSLSGQTTITVKKRVDTIKNTFDKIENRSFPSLHMAWSGIDDGSVVRGSASDIAKHDLLWHNPNFYKLNWDKSQTIYDGLTTTIDQNSLDNARNLVNSVRSTNSGTIFFACIEWIEKDSTYLPNNHEWWLRDGNGDKIKGWGEGTYQAYILDVNNQSYLNSVAAKAKAMMNTGIFDGIFIDCWKDDPSYVELARKIRELIGPDALIMVNTNMFSCPNTAPYINGLFMESYKSSTVEDWELITNTLLWAEKNLRMPRVNCLETWVVTSRQNTDDLRKMRATTTLSLTQSNGYTLFADDNSLPVGDHLHDYYNFWIKRLGRVLTQGKRKQDGSYTREYEKGIAVYNPIGNSAVNITFNEERTSVTTGIKSKVHTLAAYDGDLFIRDETNYINLEEYFLSGAGLFKEYSQIENFEGYNNDNYGLISNIGSAYNLSIDSSYGAYENSQDKTASIQSLKVQFDIKSTPANEQEFYVVNPYYGLNQQFTQPNELEFYIDTTFLTKSNKINVSFLTSDNKRYNLPTEADSFAILRQSSIGQPFFSSLEGNNGILINRSSGFKKGFIRFKLSDFRHEDTGIPLMDVTSVTKILFSSELSNMTSGEYYYLDSLNFLGLDVLPTPMLQKLNVQILDLSTHSLGSVNFSTSTIFSQDVTGSFNASIVNVNNEKAVKIDRVLAGWTTFSARTDIADYSNCEFLEFYYDSTNLIGWASIAPYIYTTNGMRYDLPGYGNLANNNYKIMEEGTSIWVSKTNSYNQIGNGLQNFKGKVRIPLNTLVQSYWYVNPKPAQTAQGYATLPADLNPIQISKIGFGFGAEGSFTIKNIMLIKYDDNVNTNALKVKGVTNGETIRYMGEDLQITYNEGTATLDANPFANGGYVENKTGSHTLVITNSLNKTTTLSFNFVIGGDVNGDGNIDIADLTMLKSHLLKIVILSGINREAADFTDNDNVSIRDLLAIKKKLLYILDG